MYSGRVIRALRQFKGYTQHEMAACLGITQQAYSRIENKEWVDKKRIEQILELLNCSKEEIHVIEIALHIK
jgi:transcriptional regulator with XRE-family HTH domain